jgi:tetratricopeptide (TPR) repeat protein
VALGTIAWRAGDVAGAQRRAEDALRTDASSADAKVLLGWCHLASRRWGDAAQRLEEAATSRTQDAALQAAIGYAYDKLGRHPDAVAAYDRALALTPAHPTAHAARGQALEAMGDVRRAVEAYTAAAAAQASNPKATCAAKVRLAALAYRERRFADARRLAEEAVAADPDEPRARHALGLACFALEDRRCTSDQEQWLLTRDRERADDLRRLLATE